jgi:hypothetical protein
MSVTLIRRDISKSEIELSAALQYLDGLRMRIAPVPDLPEEWLSYIDAAVIHIREAIREYKDEKDFQNLKKSLGE